MIDEGKTFETFGYKSTDLSYGSDKKVIAICDGCGKERLLFFKAYGKLCRSCAAMGKNNPMYGKKLSEEHKGKISKVHLGKKLSKETKKKNERKPSKHIW